MAKQAMSNVDYYFECGELQELCGSRLDTPYDYPGGFRLKFRKEGMLYNVAVVLGERVHLTSALPASPIEPSSFVRLLRQKLSNAKLEKVSQLNFDRVLEFSFGNGFSLVFEQLGKGNALLLDDKRSIVRPLRGEDFSARRLRKGEVYNTPPSDKPSVLETQTIELEKDSKTAGKLFSTVSKKLNFAPFYLEEAIARASLDKDAPASEEKANKVLVKAKEMLALQILPIVYFGKDEKRENGETDEKGGKIQTGFFSPFPLEKLSSQDFEQKQFATFGEALDAYYCAGLQQAVAAQNKPETKTNQHREKLQGALTQQKTALQTIAAEEINSRQAAEWIYANWQKAEEILKQAKDAFDKKQDENETSEHLSKKHGLKISLKKPQVEIEAQE